MNLDEQDLFKDAMAMDDVKPLKDCANVHWLKSPSTKSPRKTLEDLQLDNPLTSGFLTIIPRETPLEFKAEGIQQGVLDKLRHGKYPANATLNLLRQPVEACRQTLYSFMLLAEQENYRNLLIVHGKGREDDSHANIVRSYLDRWLQQFDLVQAYCCALPQHGGNGACYVGLKKTEQARLENRERHAKRSR